MSWTARLRLQEPLASGHAGAADRKAFHQCRKRPDLYCPNTQGSGPLAALVPQRYEIGIGQIIEKRHVNERRNEQYEDHSAERYSQATRAEQPFRSLRHGISALGKPEIQSEQATQKGQHHAKFQPVFSQENGAAESRQSGVEKQKNKTAIEAK